MSALSHTDAIIADLRERLAEANETLDAIRNGDVDAVVVGGPAGQIVYTLENADRPYRVLVEQMKEGALTIAADGMLLYANRSFADLVGRSSSVIIGSNLLDHVVDPATVEAMLHVGFQGISREIALRNNNTSVPVNLSIVELEAEDGAPRMLSGIVTDLSLHYARAREVADANARAASETDSRSRAEESLSIALDAADMASWEFDFDVGLTQRSERFDAIFGLTGIDRDWPRESALQYFLPEDVPAIRAAVAASRTTGRIEFERRIARVSDGAVRWVHLKGRTRTTTSSSVRLAGVLIDVTERHMIEEQLRQAQKMEAVGQLTGGIAHDFNNLLMIIGGSLETFARRFPLDERGRRLIEAAQTGVARGAKLNQQLLSFARRQTMKIATICINRLLPDFETLLLNAVGEAVQLRIVQDEDLWFCSTDPHQLEIAILNLAINARDAMTACDEAVLTLTTRNETVGAADADRWNAQPGDYVVTALADTGSGMEPDVIARVFEPFFTTKGVGRGTGLGLSQVYGFAKQSGGFVTIDSIVGSGSTIAIHLPRATAADETAIIAPERELGRFHGNVLLVEDDREVRNATRGMLEELGYSVREASGGRAALAELSANPDVNAVFTDVIMSTGMSGIELAREIGAQFPDMPVLLTSGYTAQQTAPMVEDHDLPLLRKPYTLTELAAAFDQLPIKST